MYLLDEKKIKHMKRIQLYSITIFVVSLLITLANKTCLLINNLTFILLLGQRKRIIFHKELALLIGE